MSKRNVRALKKKKMSEDELDLRAIRDRASEPTQSYEAVLRELKRDKLI